MIISSKDLDKSFPRGAICYSNKGGYGYINEKKVWIPAETKLTILQFDIYQKRVICLLADNTQINVTYEYLINCVRPINYSDYHNKVVDMIQIVQRTHHIISNEDLVKAVIVFMLFSVGFLIGKVF